MTRRKIRAVASSIAVALASLAGPGDAKAGTQSLHPDGGGVPTTPTDPSRFKHCAEPGADSLWETASPTEVGLDRVALQAAADYYRDQLQGTMRVYRFGCLVQTGTFDPVQERLLHMMFSTTKPTMTLVAGRAVELGLLSVDDTVGKYFPDRGDEAHRAVTLGQLLNHTSGIYKNWSMDVNDHIPDSVDHFMNLPFVAEPGTKFEYSQVGCTVASAMIERAVGEPFQRFAQREVFDKIGIQDGTYIWERDRAGWTYGYSGLYLRPIDMVRIGTLMLNRGVYRGERMVGEEFLEDMATGTEQNPGFGYNTWVNSAPHWENPGLPDTQTEHRPEISSAPHDMYFSWGWRGRHIFVMPNLGMIVTVTPTAVQTPLPGIFVDGYPGHGPGAGPGGGGQYDGRQIAQGELNGGHHEFFRFLMRAVTDQKIGDPGPWDQPNDDSFDPELFFGAPDKTVGENDWGNPEYGSWTDYAEVSQAYAKALATK